MQRILRKRILRDLKKNFPRYLALSLMIVFGIYIIISLIGSADTVIVRTRASDEEHQLEDGRFRTFVPLKEEEIKELSREGMLSIAYCGIMSSGVAYTFQVLGQKGADPAAASLILSLESVISAIAGFRILGQRLSAG